MKLGQPILLWDTHDSIWVTAKNKEEQKREKCSLQTAGHFTITNVFRLAWSVKTSDLRIPCNLNNMGDLKFQSSI